MTVSDSSAKEEEEEEAPKVVVSWLLETGRLSNAELARIANVSRSWRRAAQAAVLAQAGCGSGRRRGGCGKGATTTTATEATPLLLLPSMARSLLLLRPPKDSDSDDNIKSNNHTSKNETTNSDRNDETFCAAWFHPAGIQEHSSSAIHRSVYSSMEEDDDNDDVDYDYDDYCSGSSHEASELLFVDQDEDEATATEQQSASSSRIMQQQQQQQRRYYPSVMETDGDDDSDSDHRTPTCSEWRGYQTAHDVLHHFGYAAPFVDRVLETAAARGRKQQQQQQMAAMDGENSQRDRPRRRRQQPPPTTRGQNDGDDGDGENAFLAVRGAHLARPESYCLCVDADAQRLRRLLRRSHHSNSNPNNNNNNNNNITNNHMSDIRRREYKHSLRRKERRRRELQRQVFPRVLQRHFLQQQPSKQQPTPQQQQQQRCIQFLNASESHAVCLMTPPFHCGPLQTTRQRPRPITILCVAIATEDGCFLSGLRERCELGHLYPGDDLARATELSPVCLATGSSIRNGGSARRMQRDDDRGGDAADPAGRSSARQGSVAHFEKGDNENDEEDDDHDDSSGEDNHNHSAAPRSCHCLFAGVTEKLAAPSDDEGDSHSDDNSYSSSRAYHRRNICRGRMGPGVWHCYAAIVDGANTSLRVDGVPEPVAWSRGRTDGGDDNNDDLRAALDGLTIGSDHNFGMSLCCGNGSDGKGEGAVAEVAVFAGRLDDLDLCVLEQHMMRKHGIPRDPAVARTGNSAATLAAAAGEESPGDTTTTTTSSRNKWKDNDYARRAHALYYVPEISRPPINGNTNMNMNDHSASAAGAAAPTQEQPPSQVPLRFLSQHRAVAWKQTNPVTGEPIQIKRIGCKLGASSSDL